MTELLFKISSASYMAARMLLVFSIVSFIRLRSIKDRGKFTYDDRLRMLEDIVLIHTDEYIDSCKVQGRCISNEKSKKDNHQIF